MYIIIRNQNHPVNFFALRFKNMSQHLRGREK